MQLQLGQFIVRVLMAERQRQLNGQRPDRRRVHSNRKRLTAIPLDPGDLTEAGIE